MQLPLCARGSSGGSHTPRRGRISPWTLIVACLPFRRCRYTVDRVTRGAPSGLPGESTHVQ